MPYVFEEIIAQAKRQGWGDEAAKRAAVHFASAEQFNAVGNLNLPDDIRVILMGRKIEPDGETVARFQEASTLQAIMAVQSRLPAGITGLSDFIAGSDGDKRLMPLAEARRRLANAYAEEDQHIDTARPLTMADTARADIPVGSNVWSQRVDHNTKP